MTLAKVPEMTWDEMEVTRNEAGALLFPSTLRYRNEKGEVVEDPVYLRIPDPFEHLTARPEAREFCAKHSIDADKDKDLLDRVEDLVLLSRSIRERDSKAQKFSVEELARFGEGTLRDVKERINYLKDMLDPREPVRTEKEFWEVLFEVKRRKNLLPLADIVGHEVPSFMLRTVLEACNSPTAQSFAPSLETSTAGN